MVCAIGAIYIFLCASLFFSNVNCMRSEHQQNTPSHRPNDRERSGNPSQHETTTAPSSIQAQTPAQPAHISTARMKPVTGPGSPRYAKAHRDIAASHGGKGKVLKGTAHTGIIADSNSQFDYPKISVTPGRKDGAVLSFFHHPRHIPGDGHYQYMQRYVEDTIGDKHQDAKIYPLGFNKFELGSEADFHTRQKMLQMAQSGYQPKAALSHITNGFSGAKHKRPTVDVDPGRYHGHLVTLLYGPPSPPKHTDSLPSDPIGQTVLSSHNPTAQHAGQNIPSSSTHPYQEGIRDHSSALPLKRTRFASPSRDASGGNGGGQGGENSKRQRT